MLQDLKEKNFIQDMFLPYCQRMKRYQGDWHIESRMLVPYGIFLLTEDPDRLQAALSELLFNLSAEGKGQKALPVDEPAVEFLRGLCGDSERIDLSRGYIRSGETFVTEGPLKGKESLIRRIDRHKRLAKVEIPASGQMAEVGLEIYAKD